MKEKFQKYLRCAKINRIVIYLFYQNITVKNALNKTLIKKLRKKMNIKNAFVIFVVKNKKTLLVINIY